MRRIVGGGVLAAFSAAGVLVGGCRPKEQAAVEAGTAAEALGAGATSATPTPTMSSSTAPGEPVLAPEDRDFVDKRRGWGWSDRCYLHMKARNLPWARAACDKALEMNPASPQPRASILYNLGMVEELRGNKDGARAYYKQSLALRPNASVQGALDDLDISPEQREQRAAAAANDPFGAALAKCEVARDALRQGLAAQDPVLIQKRMQAWLRAEGDARKMIVPGRSALDVVERHRRFKEECALELSLK